MIDWTSCIGSIRPSTRRPRYNRRTLGLVVVRRAVYRGKDQ